MHALLLSSDARISPLTCNRAPEPLLAVTE